MKRRNWLIKLRGDMTRAEVAEMIGMSRVYYGQIETGRRRPSVKVAKRIADAFGFEWTKFFID